MEIMDALKQYKSLKIDKNALCSMLGNDLLNAKVAKPYVVNNQDIIFLLSQFRDSVISLAKLIEWVNIIWFTDVYTYKNKEAECIGSIMPYLEAADEEDGELTKESISKYIDCLRHNTPLK